MRKPNLVHLETLCWIARLGTFTAAADRLHIAQSAVSARIKALERALGAAIFQHRGQRAELTAEGRQIVRRSELLLQEADRFYGEVGELQNAAGVIRLGLGDLSMTWFADLMVHLQRELPRLSYEIDLDLAINLRHKLEHGDLDLVVLTGRLQDAHLITAPLAATRFVWVMSPALQHRDRRKATRDELLTNNRLWCAPRPSSIHTLAIESLRAVGANLENVNTCNRLPGMVELVLRGNGLGLVPEPLVAEKLRKQELIRVPGLPAIPMDLSIACLQGQAQPIIRHIMDAAVRYEASTHGPDARDHKT